MALQWTLQEFCTEFCTLEQFCDTAVIAVVNSARSVPALRTVKMSDVWKKFGCKDTVNLRPLKDWWCVFADGSFQSLNFQTLFLVICFDKMMFMFLLYLLLVNVIPRESLDYLFSSRTLVTSYRESQRASGRIWLTEWVAVLVADLSAKKISEVWLLVKLMLASLWKAEKYNEDHKDQNIKD